MCEILRRIFKFFFGWLFRRKKTNEQRGTVLDGTTENYNTMPEIQSVDSTPEPTLQNNGTYLTSRTPSDEVDLPVERIPTPPISESKDDLLIIDDKTPREEEAYRTLPQMEREPTLVEKQIKKVVDRLSTF
jgi:hypothetical protein